MACGALDRGATGVVVVTLLVLCSPDAAWAGQSAQHMQPRSGPPYLVPNRKVGVSFQDKL